MCAAAEVPIPTVGNLGAVRDGDSETGVLLARVAAGGTVVGFALSCADGLPLATVYLGPFPARLQALQLTTRTSAGEATRFGEVFRADAASGFRSPRLVGEDPAAFLEAVLAPGTLVSNGPNEDDRTAAVGSRPRRGADWLTTRRITTGSATGARPIGPGV